MLQPTQYDVVLGGQNDLSTSAVLGGKGCIDRAILALTNPASYEQAKQILLNQPKITHRNLNLKKFKSAKEASQYFRSLVVFGKQIHGNTWEYAREYERNKAFIWFSTPSIKRVGFEYIIDPSNLCRWDEYGNKMQLHHFMRRVIKYTGKYHKTRELVCEITFKDLQTVVEELPNAFNFRFVDGEGGLVEPEYDEDYCNYQYHRDNDPETLIGHYWDNQNSKMILLP